MSNTSTGLGGVRRKGLLRLSHSTAACFRVMCTSLGSSWCRPLN